MVDAGCFLTFVVLGPIVAGHKDVYHCLSWVLLLGVRLFRMNLCVHC